MGDRSRERAAHAFTDGIARVTSAPAVLAGTIAIVWLYGAAADIRHVAGAFLLWAFLSGGILDRYARGRVTRARGFFGACGAHLGAMVRLGLLVVLALGGFHLIVRDGFENPYVHKGAFAVAVFVSLVVSYAQIRIAVEDRRSAMGAFLAGGRFVVRNPATIVIYVVYAALMMAAMLAYERVAPGPHTETWTAFVIAEALIAAYTLLVLASFASGVSLFQSRLAHAGYTAAPPIEWPESPAAEAIENAFPTAVP